MAKIYDVFVKAFYIAKKDAKVYYFKTPNFTYSLLIPVSLFLAFSMAGNISSKLIVAGLSSLVVLFGTILAGVIIFPLAAVSGVVVMNPVLAVIAIAFTSMAFSALGIVASAYAKWVPEAQMISNFLRFPMVFLAGTFAAFGDISVPNAGSRPLPPTHIFS